MRKVITAIVLLLAVLLAACSGTRSTPENVAQELGVSLPETVSVGYEDTHGGFHGDGETFVTLTFSADDAAALQAQLAEQGWQPLPMEGEMRAAVYGGALDGINYGDSIFAPREVPPPENGWYWFYDRHSDAADPHSADGLLARASRNFTAAVFDADRNALYYYELDT